MVSSMYSIDASDIVQMFKLYNKMKSADTDGVQGLSKAELSSIDTGANSVESDFLQALSACFDKLDSDGDGELSRNEIVTGISSHAINPPTGSQLSAAEDADSCLD